MDLDENLQTELSHLNTSELRLLAWFVRYRLIRHRLSQLKPRQMIPIVAISEAAAIALAVNTHNALIAAVGTFATVAIGMFPLLLQPAPIKAHWVKGQKSFTETPWLL